MLPWSGCLAQLYFLTSLQVVMQCYSTKRKGVKNASDSSLKLAIFADLCIAFFGSSLHCCYCHGNIYHHDTTNTLISCLWLFQNDPKSFWNDLNHATLRRSVPRRPGRARWLRRRPRLDGRVEVCAKPVPTLVEPRTFSSVCSKRMGSSGDPPGQSMVYRSGIEGATSHPKCAWHEPGAHTHAEPGGCMDLGRSGPLEVDVMSM